MSGHTLRFETECPDLSPGGLRLRRASGRHAMSAPYEYALDFDCDVDGGLSVELIEALLVHPCRIEIGLGGLAPAEVGGVLRRFELLPMRPEGTVSYRATMVPRLWRTSLSAGSRIFQDLSWPDVAARVLTDHEIDFELRLTQSYPAREYTVQYEEDDLAFVSRLLEHHGIFYFFEQLPSGERMVITDAASHLVALTDHEVLGYTHETGSAAFLAQPSVAELGRVHEVRPARVDLKDYNWRHPGVIPEGESAADEASGYGTVHAYGDHFKDPAEGASLARVRAEELLADREVYRGRTSVPALAPGHRFQLNGYPSGDLDQDYLVTEIEHSLAEDGAFDKRFTAIPYAVPYRPRRVTHKPRVAGTMHAIVDGEVPGTAAPIDELGRYKLLFPFDRVATPGGRASRWVRMAQSSTGAGYGMHLPLHIGCEVAVLHVGGDPDRPIVVGAVPNADTISPVTQLDATKSRIRTRSGILIEMEDDGS